jgi:hypothetical protein
MPDKQGQKQGESSSWQKGQSGNPSGRAAQRRLHNNGIVGTAHRAETEGFAERDMGAMRCCSIAAIGCGWER